MTKTELHDIRKEIDDVFARLEADLDTPKVNTTNSSDSNSYFKLHWATILFVPIIIFGDALIAINGREFTILILLAFNFGCFFINDAIVDRYYDKKLQALRGEMYDKN